MSAKSEATTDVTPFSNGTEAEVWCSSNCERCALDGYRVGGTPCPMEEAISLGFVIGTVPAMLAAEFGATVRGEYCDMPRQCPQFTPGARCEYVLWPGTRRRRRCGAAATGEHTAKGLGWAVCDRHARIVAKAVQP